MSTVPNGYRYSQTFIKKSRQVFDGKFLIPNS